MKKLNEKYVMLLQKSYDKYKNLSVIEISNKDGKEEKGKVDISDGAKSLKDKQYITPNSKNKTVSVSNQKRKDALKYHLKHSMKKRYTPEEDELLLPAIHNEKHKDFKELALLLNRDITSVRGRIRYLRRSSKIKKKKLSFSLTEDLAIVDVAMEFIIMSESFEVPLPKFQALAAEINRGINSVSKRWDRRLKIWIRRYYHKTLDLEIRPMLANLIAEQYDNVDDIDWKKVIQHSEFLGHTEDSLSYIYFCILIPNGANHFGKPRMQLTLKEVAEYAGECYKNPKISKPMKIRQTQVISHFENLVKERKLLLKFQDL